MDPLLDSMIDRGCPLNRETLVDLMWGADTPKPWTVEHEMDVPEFWRNLDLVEDDEEEEDELEDDDAEDDEHDESDRHVQRHFLERLLNLLADRRVFGRT